MYSSCTFLCIYGVCVCGWMGGWGGGGGWDGGMLGDGM